MLCLQRHRKEEMRMEATDALMTMLAELLIENSVMRALLKNGIPDLDVILRDAKANQQRRRKAEELIVKVREALANETDLEEMMQRIAESSNNENPS